MPLSYIKAPASRRGILMSYISVGSEKRNHLSLLSGLSGPEVRRSTPGASGCIEGLQARAPVPAPPGVLSIATLPRPLRPSPPSPPAPFGGKARVADCDRAPSAWSALCGLLPQRRSPTSISGRRVGHKPIVLRTRTNTTPYGTKERTPRIYPFDAQIRD